MNKLKNCTINESLEYCQNFKITHVIKYAQSYQKTT